MIAGIENMTEKESAHPLSPSASIDIGKSIGNRSESKTDIAEESMNATKNSVVPVRNRETKINIDSNINKRLFDSRRRVASVWPNKRTLMWTTWNNGCHPATGYGNGRASFHCRLSCDCFKFLYRKSRRSALISEFNFYFRKKQLNAEN